MSTVTKEKKATTTTKRKTTSTAATKKKTTTKKVSPLELKFEAALKTLEEAKPFAKSLYQTDVYQLANELAQQDDGMSILFKYAHRFDEVGVFLDGDWEDPTKLQPPFVGGSLRLRGIYSIMEMLSEMRMLAIAKETYKHASLSSEDASAFLNEVLALNLDLLFPEESLDENQELEEHLIRAKNLFNYLGQELSFEAIAEKMIQEIDRLATQRPIITRRIVELIDASKKLVNDRIDENTLLALDKYTKAIHAPSPLSTESKDLRDYKLKLDSAKEDELIVEAKHFAQSMDETGLVSPYHAILLRFLNRNNDQIIQEALSLNETGGAALKDHKSLISDLIQLAIYPETKQSIYGLSRTLNRGVLKLEGLASALRQLFELPIHAQVQSDISKFISEQSGISANGTLLAGVISVLGQPLGIGQGENQICQSARAISLWAQYDIAKLVDFITSAARENSIEMTFEGETIHSSLLIEEFVSNNPRDLDLVSIILVPHLNKIYNEMMKRTLLRGEDGHKWVNREFYGDWIQSGFVNAIDQLTLKVKNYPAFVKLFYATHHPEYNEGYKLIYPNPVGIFTTNVHGDLLGLHAVSIQRIEKDHKGEYRIYFYNPNNDSTQNWGQGIKSSVAGFGELEGESSLPFHEFVSRMYAYHYDPYEQGETYMVEDKIVQTVEELARNSWGKNYAWA